MDELIKNAQRDSMDEDESQQEEEDEMSEPAAEDGLKARIQDAGSDEPAGSDGGSDRSPTTGEAAEDAGSQEDNGGTGLFDNKGDGRANQSDNGDQSSQEASGRPSIQDSTPGQSPTASTSAPTDRTRDEDSRPLSETHGTGQESRSLEERKREAAKKKPKFSQPDKDWDEYYEEEREDGADEPEQEETGVSSSQPQPNTGAETAESQESEEDTYDPDVARKRYQNLKEQAKNEFLQRQKERARREQQQSEQTEQKETEEGTREDADDEPASEYEVTKKPDGHESSTGYYDYDPDSEGNVLH